MSALDQDFETGVRLIRDAYMKKLSEKESENVTLKGENARKDAEIRELQQRIAQLEVQVTKSDKRISEMTRILSKLNHFKQSVLNSFQEDEYGDLKKRTAPSGGGGGYAGHSTTFGSHTNIDTVSLEHLNGQSTATQVHGYSSPAINIQPLAANSVAATTGGGEFLSGRRPTAEYLGSTSAARPATSIADYTQQHQQPAVSVGRSNVNKDDYKSILNDSIMKDDYNNVIPAMENLGVHDHRQDDDDYEAEIRRVKRQIQENQTRKHQQQHHLFSSNNTSSTARPRPHAPYHLNTTASNTINHSPSSPKSSTRNTPGPSNISQLNNSTGGGHTVDGRDYFRRAKSILSYDDFTDLLWNVKAYNNREQSRSKTLENVHASIGAKYRDLYVEFEQLLSS